MLLFYLSFYGPVKMGIKTAQKYLVDLISIDGKQARNAQARNSKGLGNSQWE